MFLFSALLERQSLRRFFYGQYDFKIKPRRTFNVSACLAACIGTVFQDSCFFCRYDNAQLILGQGCRGRGLNGPIRILSESAFQHDCNWHFNCSRSVYRSKKIKGRLELNRQREHGYDYPAGNFHDQIRSERLLTNISSYSVESVPFLTR